MGKKRQKTSTVSSGAPVPGAGAVVQGTGAAAPDAGAAVPGAGTVIPGTSAPVPGAGAKRQKTSAVSSGALVPGAGAAVRGSGAAVPGAGTAAPGAGTVVPGAGAPLPGAGAPVPGAGTPVPGVGSSVPGAGAAVPGASTLVSGAGAGLPCAGAPVPGAGSSVPGAGAAVPGASALVSGAGAPVSGAGAPVPGAGVLVPGASAPVPGAGAPVPGAGAPVPGAPVPGAGAAVPGAPVPCAGAAVPGVGAPVPVVGAPVPGACAPVPSAYHITDEDHYKLKVIKSLDTAGKGTVFTAYQSYKRYDDSITIKQHFLSYPGKSEEQYNKEIKPQYRNVIETTPASGEDYDISALGDCMRLLRRLYEINNDTINKKCQAIANMRNKHCHDLSGISYTEFKKAMEDIEILSMDVLTYLETKCPISISQITDMKKEVKEGIKGILDQPLSQTELEEFKFRQHLQIFNDEIKPYKNRCIDWAKIKMLDFLSVCNDLHDVNLLFTDIIVEKSDRSNRNTPVKYSDIIDFVSNTNLLLLDSEPGGGKTTVVKYTINDWSKDLNIMKTSNFKYIFPVLFRDPHLRSVGDLIREKIPKVRESMADQNVIKCIADPSSDILFVCDGYDECNDQSEQLFDDICRLKEDYDHIKVIVTSRPEAVRKLYDKRPSKLNIDHLKLRGIPESLRAEFLEKHHNALFNAGESKESTKELIVFYKGCSAKHQELYRMPINMAILAWLWGQGPQRVKSIKSAAGLYTAILSILKDKLSNRIVRKPEFKDTVTFSFNDEIKDLVKRFEKRVYKASLNALKCNRVFLDELEVNSLKEVCNDVNPLILEELQSAYLLTKLEWKDELTNTLELPHKGFLDFYAAKCIESQVSPGEKRVKDILLQLYNYDPRQYKINLSSYQNVLQLLGGILALKDPSLVDDHGADIIVLLQNTGIRNNTQWYTVYYDLIGNTTAADKFARIIAPYLELENLSIKDAQVEALSSLLQYVNIDKVVLDISSNDTLPQLPALIDVLRSKNCIIEIEEISDDQFPLWNSIITQYTKIHIDTVIINNKVKILPFLDMCDYIREIRCVYSWRDLHKEPNFSRLENVDTIYATASTIDTLPTSLKNLYIGLQQDSEGQDAIYPHGWSRLTERCPGLWEIHVHVRSPMRCDHLSALLDMTILPWLYLSQVKTEEDLHWAVRTAVQLQPTGGYDRIVLPSCQLNANQLCELFKKLGNSGVNVLVEVVIGSRHSSSSTKVEDLARQVLGVTVYWFTNDEDIPGW